MNPLKSLEQQGQSVWLDFITRDYISNGSLAKLINEDGVKGVTSNPAIFQKAISSGREYDPIISDLQAKGHKAAAIFEQLAVEDIQAACDAFKGVYEKSKALDGYVSLEVNPHLSQDTQGTLNEARSLFKRVNRPNVMIKIPGTKACLPAIEQALGEGININITLIFSLERYQAVIDAWLAGLERLAKAGKPLQNVASVASFFVSRVDSAIDPLLEKKNLNGLLGKAAIANACEAYEMFLRTEKSARFQALKAKGAQVQRPLWASTGTKNPQYSDVLYLEELIGRDTVNTVPLPTLEAFRDHGKLKQSLPNTNGKAVLAEIAKAGISMDEITQKLEVDGLKLFEDAYDSLIKSLDQKKEALKAGA